MEVKNKNVSLCLGVAKKVADLAVSLTIPFPGIASCCLKKLSCNCEGAKELMTGSEEAALAFALYENIRDKLMGSPLEISKSRAGGITCRSINNNIVITWNCQGTGASLNKTCKIVAACLNPIKLYSRYNENIKFLSGKGGDREVFNYCVKKLAMGIKKSVYFAAVGKITMNPKKLAEIIKAIEKKLPDLEFPSAKEIANPEKRPKDTGESYPSVKCSGIAAVAVADYIRSNSLGMAVEVTGNEVIVYNMSWESKHKQLKDSSKISDYVDKKYSKLGDAFPTLFAYYALTQEMADGQTISRIIKSKPKMSELSALIKKAL
jgi:hypothetical protein